MKKLADRLLIVSFFIITNTVSISTTNICNKVTPIYPRFYRHSLSKERNITGYCTVHQRGRNKATQCIGYLVCNQCVFPQAREGDDPARAFQCPSQLSSSWEDPEEVQEPAERPSLFIQASSPTGFLPAVAHPHTLCESSEGENPKEETLPL